MNIAASCLKARHFFAADTTSAYTDTTRHRIWTLKDRLSLCHLLFAGLVVKLEPFVLFNFTFLLKLLHSLLLLELLLLQIFFVVGSDSLIAILWKHFNANFVLFELLDVRLSLVLICFENHTHVTVVRDRFDGCLVKS